jgi:8-oxo-dGTP pyrophosphatase MutT (NUDIX family)
MKTIWHLRVRAVVYEKGKFLVVRSHGSEYCFLPGGHVEEGESVPVALEREMLEESGRACEVGGYLGCVEQSWISGDTKHWENTHLFHVTIPHLETNPDIKPSEEGFDFLWIAPAEFEKYNFLPKIQRDLMQAWAQGDEKTWWASSME